MDFTLHMLDKEGGRQVEVAQSDVEYLGDLVEVLLNFIQASGYTYVTNITLSDASGKEWSSL